jgi:hypothetical protein
LTTILLCHAEARSICGKSIGDFYAIKASLT